MLLSKITALIGGIGGALLGAGIGLADDAVFTLLDGTSGYKEWGEVGLDFGKKVAMAGVSVATAGMFNGFDAAIGSEAVGGMFGKTMGLMDYLPTSGIESVIGKTVLTGMQQVTNTIANSAINAITWDAENGLGFSNEAMSAGMQSGMVGALSSMTSVFTGGSLGLLNMYDGNGTDLSSKIFNTQSIQSFNGLAGGLAGAGVTFAITGNASFNILNASDLTGGRLQGGLFELHVGKDGFSGRIGMGGTNLSVGTIASSLSGFVDTMKIGTAKLGAAFGLYEGVSTLNGANMLGYTNNDFNYTLGKNLWSGKLKATYADVGDDYGRYDSRNPGEIVLSDRLLGNGLDKAAMLASVMSHEGTHAYGNRYEAIAHQQGLITYASLAEQFEFQTDRSFVEGMVDGLKNPASYVENTGPIDYLKLRYLVNSDRWDIVNDGNPEIVVENYYSESDIETLHSFGPYGNSFMRDTTMFGLGMIDEILSTSGNQNVREDLFLGSNVDPDKALGLNLGSSNRVSDIVVEYIGKESAATKEARAMASGGVVSAPENMLLAGGLAYGPGMLNNLTNMTQATIRQGVASGFFSGAASLATSQLADGESLTKGETYLKASMAFGAGFMMVPGNNALMASLGSSSYAGIAAVGINGFGTGFGLTALNQLIDGQGLDYSKAVTGGLYSSAGALFGLGISKAISSIPSVYKQRSGIYFQADWQHGLGRVALSTNPTHGVPLLQNVYRPNQSLMNMATTYFDPLISGTANVFMGALYPY